MDQKDSVSYLVYESSTTRLDRIIKRLVISLVVAIILIFVSNALWLYAWTRYDYVSETTVYTQDGRGINIIGDHNGPEQNGIEAETP